MIGTHRHPLIALIIAVAAGSTICLSGCATAPEPTTQKTDQTFDELKARLAESERLNKRLDRKIGRLEQVIAVTQDRIEAQTLANQYDLHQQHQPDPVPESRYPNALSGRGRHNDARKNPVGFRKERRITLGGRRPVDAQSSDYGYYVDDDAADEVIVITQDDFDAFAESSPKPQRSTSASTRRGRTPQPDVTQERLRVGHTAGHDRATRPEPPSRSTVQPDASALAIYEEGLSFYRSGDYSRSLASFKTFLDRNPEPSYLDNALYWIGESYFGLNDMKKSIHYFKRVIKETPTGNKVPNAMLKMAMAYRNIGQNKTSKSVLSKIVKKYPTSGAGQIAKRELEK